MELIVPMNGAMFNAVIIQIMHFLQINSEHTEGFVYIAVCKTQ